MGISMKRIDRILKDNLFLDNLGRIVEAEKGRPFCHHDMAHFLDVARIARILAAEEGLGVEAELIYASALLHDIGKHLQYKKGTPHELASAELAAEILPKCGFDREETGVIIDAILEHRNQKSAGEESLKGILYRADKLSRACFCCPAEGACDWGREKKNLNLDY